MHIELIPLATVTLIVSPDYATIPRPEGGTRLIAEIVESRWAGERLNARQKGKAAADWAVTFSDGSAQINVRTTLETDDGALIFVRYEGRVYVEDKQKTLIIAPLFQTGHPRYSWLNSVQAIGRGRSRDGALVYGTFEVR